MASEKKEESFEERAEKFFLRCESEKESVVINKRVKLTLNEADDVNIDQIDALIPPQILMQEYPSTEKTLKTVSAARLGIERILAGKDDRLVVVVGPCSIHDVDAALEYATWLKGQAVQYSSELLIVMRVYFEKPRTTGGWKGLINDPNMDGSFSINKGLKIGRQLLLQVNEMGLPASVEFLDTITPQFFGDLVAWGAIGARTTESQVHRELASGLSCPVGFKNGTSGDVLVAAQACKAAQQPHSFLSVTKQSLAAIVRTHGNMWCHLVLRGGAQGPNYSAENIDMAVKCLTGLGVCGRVMIDCSHGNSLKQHTRQSLVVADVAAQVAGGCPHIFAVMIESNINEGNQSLDDRGISGLSYGVSITDACVSVQQTEPMLVQLAEAVKQRRQILSASK